MRCVWYLLAIHLLLNLVTPIYVWHLTHNLIITIKALTWMHHVYIFLLWDVLLYVIHTINNHTILHIIILVAGIMNWLILY